MKYIDTHCHLNISEYKIQNNMLMINIATNKESLIENKNFWCGKKNIFNTIGIHPCDLDYFNKNNTNDLKQYINEDTVAIGEIGIDYFHKNFSNEIQIKYFEEQIIFANKMNLPVVVHTRDSIEDTFMVISKYKNVKFLLHSWSGDIKQTEMFLSLGKNIYFSYNGILTFKNAHIQKEAIKIIPENRLMFETDSPYLSPEPFRGQKNEPKRVVEVIKYAASLLGKTYIEMNDNNNKVAIDFFGLNGDIFNES